MSKAQIFLQACWHQEGRDFLSEQSYCSSMESVSLHLPLEEPAAVESCSATTSAPWPPRSKILSRLSSWCRVTHTRGAGTDALAGSCSLVMVRSSQKS